MFHQTSYEVWGYDPPRNDTTKLRVQIIEKNKDWFGLRIIERKPRLVMRDHYGNWFEYQDGQPAPLLSSIGARMERAWQNYYIKHRNILTVRMIPFL